MEIIRIDIFFRVGIFLHQISFVYNFFEFLSDIFDFTTIVGDISTLVNDSVYKY